MTWKRILSAVLVLLVALILFITWRQVIIPAVDYLIMDLDEGVETLLVSGRVSGDGAVPLSFKRPGRLTEILVQEGDEIAREEVLARLEDSEPRNLEKQAENNLVSAQVALSRLENRDLPQAEEALSQSEKRAEIAENLYQSAVKERLVPATELVEEKVAEKQEALEFFEEQERLFQEGQIEADELEEAASSLESAIDALAGAEDERDRIEREVDNLFREKEIAQSQVRAAQSALESLKNEELRQARLNVTQAENQLEQARLELEETILKAPFRGVVTRLSANPSQFVSIGQEICVVIPAAGEVTVEAGVDEEFAGVVQVGQEAIVRSSAFPERLFFGRITRVSPTIDPERGTFQVRLVLDQFEPALLPDMAVNVELIIERFTESLILEQGLTFRDNDSLYVLVEDDGKVGKRELTVRDLGGGYYLVERGLQPGDRVLLDTDLEPGQRIRLRDRGID